MKGSRSLVDNQKNKEPVLSLREIAAGKVHFDRQVKTVLTRRLSELQAEHDHQDQSQPEGRHGVAEQRHHLHRAIEAGVLAHRRQDAERQRDDERDHQAGEAERHRHRHALGEQVIKPRPQIFTPG